MSSVIEKDLQRPAPGPQCLGENEAFEVLSAGLGSPRGKALLSHVEMCSPCRRLIGVAARQRGQIATNSPPRGLCTLAPGDVVGNDRYQIRGLLARGGMGEVYEAHDRVLDEVVALKTIVLAALDNERALMALKAEVQLSRKVSHRNVCRIFDFGAEVTDPTLGGAPETIPFFTMELLRGETLRQYLMRHRRLKPAQALPLVLQIIDGLEAIHAAGIVHRDLKPENVFLLNEPQGLRVVVVDFGLARPMDVPQSMASWAGDGGGARPAGTLEYMAPEQLRGDRPTVSFDVYALGTIMFELLAGVRPFAPGGQANLGTALARLDHTPPTLSALLSDADPLWDTVIACCLARSPADRYACIAHLREALGPRAPGSLDSGPAGGSLAALAAAPRARPWRPWRAAVTGATLLAATAAVVVTGRHWRDAPVAPPSAPASPPAAAHPPIGPSSAVPPPLAPAPAARSLQPAEAAPRAAAAAQTPLRGRSRPVGPRVAIAARSPALAPAPSPPSAAAEPAAPRVPAIIERAERLLVQGAAAEACALGEQVAALAPQAPASYLFLGKCYMRLPDAERGRRSYRRFLELAPNDPDAVFVRAIVGVAPEMPKSRER
jgi:hypothetical protein